MNAEQSAAALLQATWGDRDFPVDPAQIAKQLGLEVIDADLPMNVSGALVKKRDQDAIILLNQTDSKNRKRFSCAHELGHYIQRVQQDGESYEYIDLRGDEAATGCNPDEVFANKFAASLLMPEEEVRRLCKEKTPPFLMALHFSVSDDAMRFRLKNLGL